MIWTTSLLRPKNERQWSVNDFNPCILGSQGAVGPHLSMIELSVAFLGKNTYYPIVTMAQNVSQPSLNVASTEYSRSINGVSTIFELASCIIKQQWNAVNPEWTYQQPLLVTLLVTISHPPPTIERPWSISSFCGGSVRYTAINCIALLPNWVLRGQFFQYVLVSNFTNIYRMSHRSHFLAYSSNVNI